MTEEMSLRDELAQAMQEEPVIETEQEFSTDSENGATETPETATSETEKVLEALEAPISWKKEQKEKWEKLSGVEGGREIQQYILEREKERDSHLTKQSQATKPWEQVNEIFARYPQIKQEEYAPTVQRWASIAESLERNPLQTLNNLAQMYGVQLGAQNEEEDPFIDPHVKTLMNEINGLKAERIQREQSEQYSKLSSVQKTIDDFKNAKDEDGNALHPYYEEVEELMAKLAEPGADLKDLYERAIYANPEVRAKVLAAEKAQQEEQRKKEAIAKAKSAKKQSSSIEGGSAGSDAPVNLDLREELQRNLRAAGG